MALVVTALVALSAAGCGEDDKPQPVVVPGVQADGSYQVGTLPDDDASAALEAAVAALPVAVSFDYRTLDDSLAKATALMTPEFAADFRRVFDKTTRALAVKNQTIQTSLVRAAGVVDKVKDDQVTCLIYLNQIVVASKNRKPDSPLNVDQVRVNVTLEKIDGAWKVKGIEPF